MCWKTSQLYQTSRNSALNSGYTDKVLCAIPGQIPDRRNSLQEAWKKTYFMIDAATNTKELRAVLEEIKINNCRYHLK